MEELVRQRRKRKSGREARNLNVACWNVRSLVKNDGSLETGRVRQSERSMRGGVERKAMILVWELKRYSTFAAAISETQWFGNNIFEVEDHVILHSGRKLPGEQETIRRGEGAGIVLSAEAAKAWRDGGEQWEPVNSRIVSARLRLRGGRQQCSHLTLVSVYAPTLRSPQEIKDDFFADLQSVLDRVPAEDVVVLLGDWNARVGSRHGSQADRWEGVLGKHSLGNMNEAGLFLLSFCSMNNLSIVNTFFEKKDIYKQTWQHPGTKAWHCIDYILMRQNQRKQCSDAQSDR